MAQGTFATSNVMRLCCLTQTRDGGATTALNKPDCAAVDWKGVPVRTPGNEGQASSDSPRWLMESQQSPKKPAPSLL